VWVRTSAANAVRIGIDMQTPSDNFTYSTYHTGNGAYQVLTVTAAPVAGTQIIQPFISFSGSCTAYIDNAMLVVGSVPADYAPLHPADDLARCLRYYENACTSVLHAGWSGAASEAIGSVLRSQARKPVAPTVTKVGSWSVANCGQPIVAGADNDGGQLYALSSAIGHVQFAASGTAYVSCEANP